MKDIDYISKNSEIEKRAAARLEIQEVFRNGKNFQNTINFLTKQSFLHYKSIIDLISYQKDDLYPIGYIMLNKSNAIVGFVGSWFSKRKIENQECTFCNIHSWIVEQEYRIYSFYLISLLNKKDINLTAYTPVESLKGLLEKYGFKKKEIIYKVIFNLGLFKFLKKEYEIIEDKKDIENKLSKTSLDIHNLYNNKVYKSFLIRNINEEDELFVIGCVLRKKGLKIFNLFYISNIDYFQKHYNEILNTISKRLNVYFFSEYDLGNEKNFFPDKIILSKSKKKTIYLKTKNEISNLELLNSDLII